MRVKKQSGGLFFRVAKRNSPPLLRPQAGKSRLPHQKQETIQRGACDKAGFTYRKHKRSTSNFVRTPFCYYRAVISLPCVKGGGTACRDGGIVKTKYHRKTIPQPPSASAPFAQGSLWFVRPETPSTFPDKHCICGHKS